MSFSTSLGLGRAQRALATPQRPAVDPDDHRVDPDARAGSALKGEQRMFSMGKMMEKDGK